MRGVSRHAREGLPGPALQLGSRLCKKGFIVLGNRWPSRQGRLLAHYPIAVPRIILHSIQAFGVNALTAQYHSKVPAAISVRPMVRQSGQLVLVDPRHAYG